MGDRANVYVHEGPQPGVYLYTHWGGTELPDTLRTALARGMGRWGDTPYLTRIIFSDMVRDDIDGSTGYGISADLGDGADRILDVDTVAYTVTVQSSDWSSGFEDYVQGARSVPSGVW